MSSESEGERYEYDSSAIRIVDGLESVRRRPGMYVGNTDDGTGVLNMIRELVSNPLDFFLMGECARIEVTTGDVIEVWDDGPGMPFDDADDPRESTAMRVLTQVHHRASHDDHAPHIHALAYHGIGLAPVVALSELFEVWSVRGGVLWHVIIVRGELELCDCVPSAGEYVGTTIRMIPDPTLLLEPTPDRAGLESMLSGVATILSPIQIALDGVELTQPLGLLGHARASERAAGALIEIESRQLSDDVRVDLVVLAAREPSEPADIVSWVNGVETVEHGDHVAGVLAGCQSAGVYPLVVRVHAIGYSGTWAAPTRDRFIHPALAASLEERVRNLLG